jgi:phospholipase C
VLLAAAFAVVTLACSTTGEAQPAPADASSIQTRWPIKHVVFIIKENRSFNEFFATFPGARKTTLVGMLDGQPKPLVRGTADRLPNDLPHDRTAAVKAVNGGKMDGFGLTGAAKLYAYSYLLEEDIPNYWYWAEEYVLSDNFFASANGPSFPNHLYTIAAQSGGAVDNTKQPFAGIREMQEQGLAKTWGCDAAEGATVEVVDSEGETELVDPCFDFRTVGDLLSARDIPWAYYAATPNQDGYIWSAYNAIGRYRNDQELWDRHMRPVDELIADIEADRLPPVTWVTPRFELSEHPEFSLCHGENWTTEVINAIMRSPMWEDTAIFLTYDDWGGFYDPAPPVSLDPIGLGIRVPTWTISPYAKRGVFDHKLGEFSTIVRFIEDNWGLTQLTHRDEQAHDMRSNFDFSQPPRPPDPRPLRSDCEGPEWAVPPSWV